MLEGTFRPGAETLPPFPPPLSEKDSPGRRHRGKGEGEGEASDEEGVEARQESKNKERAEEEDGDVLIKGPQWAEIADA